MTREEAIIILSARSRILKKSKKTGKQHAAEALDMAIEALSQPERPKGRWELTLHKERVNYRWNVTAKCSECADEKGKIWVGFFPGVPDSITEKVAFTSAKEVVMPNFCEKCGCDMRGEEE